MSQVDAIVIGAGHNGLVAANRLADAGWDVLVLETAEQAGGAIRSDNGLHPDFVTDWYSSFYPLAAASPAIAELELEKWGLSWRHAPIVLAHVFPDGRCAVLHRDVDVTAASMETFGAGDGDAWTRLASDYRRIAEPFLRSALGPFPPVRSAVRLARAMGVADALRFARFAVQPVRRFGEETFTGPGGPILLAGNALHTDLGPESAGSAIYGWLLCMLGQTVGFPVPVGGSGGIVDALTRRLEAKGGQIRLGAEVVSVAVKAGTVQGVRLRSGEFVTARTVVADVGAPQLYLDLVGEQHLPARLIDDLTRFQWDTPTLKVNWALSSPIPWISPAAREAGTVHLGADLNGLTGYAASLAMKKIPTEPFILLGQMTTADSTRSPAGTESVWAYTHLPSGLDLSPDDVERQALRVESTIENLAPGFSSSVLARSVQSPRILQQADANLHDGAVGGGTAAIHQELFFRPVPGLARADTTIDGLFLASASAHPGGGVHGAAGSNAAAAALRRQGPAGRLYRTSINAAYRRIYR